MRMITDETEINSILHMTEKKRLCLKGQTESIHSNLQKLLNEFV